MIAEPFELLQLPRFSQKASNVISTCADADSLFVGASGSSISQLGLRPPQVLRTHAVAPTVTVTSILAKNGRIVAYGSIERSKNLLHLLPAAGESEAASSVELPGPIAQIYISNDESVIGVLAGDSDPLAVAFSATDLTEISRVPQSTSQRRLYSSVISNSEAETTLLTVDLRADGRLAVSLLALDRHGFAELSQRLLDLDFNERMQYSYRDAALYIANGTEVLAYSVPQMEFTGKISGRKNDADIKGLIALENANLAVLRGNEIQLLDFTYRSLIGRRTITGGVAALWDYVPSASAIIASQGATLIGIPVQPTQGTLLESVGRSYAPVAESLPLTDIFAGFTQPPAQYKSVAKSQLANAQQELDQVIKDLERFIKQRDGPAFASIVTYLKSPSRSWAEVQAEADTAMVGDDLVFDEQLDRNADRRLVRRACELAFLPRFKPYLPLGVAVYLLTHPLFPLGEPQFSKLMSGLEKSDAMLYRQALVSLSGLSVPDLVRGLLTSDEATFLDAATRLQEDYSAPQILQGIRQAFRASRSTSALSVLVERLSRYPETVPLMASFIDAMGLLAWNVDHIRSMQTQLHNQIGGLEECVVASTAIADLFNTMGLNPSESAAVTVGEAKQRNAQHTAVVAGNERRVVPKYRIETLVL